MQEEKGSKQQASTPDESRWEHDADVMVLKVYCDMAANAKNEATFRAALKLAVKFADEIGYLQEGNNA